MEKETVFSLIDTLIVEVNVIHFLMDEGYVTDDLKIKEGISIKELNERLEEELSIEKMFSSKRDFKKWLIALSDKMKNLSGLIKLTV